jgi:cytochrome c-type protein NapB
VRRGPNAEGASHLADLDAEPPTPELLEGRAERLADALARRAARRAYDGAPPRVPHAIDERSTSACLACHAEGLIIAERVAPRMSHPVYQNCTQCHVSESTVRIEAATSPSANTFVGMLPEAGRRFLPDAPPVMPHPRWMRETCASCHGALGPPGLRTTHPERQSCEQCHVPAPGLAQEVFAP